MYNDIICYHREYKIRGTYVKEDFVKVPDSELWLEARRSRHKKDADNTYTFYKVEDEDEGRRLKFLSKCEKMQDEEYIDNLFKELVRDMYFGTEYLVRDGVQYRRVKPYYYG